MYHFKPQGVCPSQINIDLDNGTISHVDFVGGCNGNLKAISKLIEGMSVDEVAALLEGNTCGAKKTSCADQLVKGLRAAEAELAQ